MLLTPGANTVGSAMQVSRDEDASHGAQLCDAPIAVIEATEAELTEFATALEPFSDFDYLTLLVHVASAAYFVDVGWGDDPHAPLPAEAGEYPSRPRPARIETDASTLRLFEYVELSGGTVVWELQYQASHQPRRLAEFEARSR